jgi:hypothetical protein
MSGDIYDVGGSFGGGLTGADGACAEQCICSALDGGLAAIVEALTSIDNTLADTLGQGSQATEEAQAAIAAAIEAAIANAIGPIEAAQAEIQAQIAEQQISMDGIRDDLILIGTKPEEEEIVIEEPPQQPIQNYYGWCDFEGGEVTVTNLPEPPGPTFTLVSTGDNEIAVEQEAQNTCKTYTTESEEQTQEPGNAVPATSFTSNCNIMQFSQSDFIAGVVGQSTGAYDVGAYAEALNAYSKFGIEGINLGNLGQVIAGVTRVGHAEPAYVASKIVPAIAKSLGCQSDNWVNGMMAFASIGVTKEITGVDFMPFATSLEYAVNASCRRKFSEPKEALDAYLANGLDYQELDTMYAIAGFCPSSVEEDIIAAKAKREAEQLISMRHREIIDPETFGNGMRQLGYVDTDWVEQIWLASEHLPDIATATHVVASGALDGGQVSRYQLETGQEGLRQEPAVSWIKAAGISQETANLFWQAHWINPSVGNLIEFYHRLRDDDKFGGAAQMEEDSRAAMQANGITPFWQDRFIATFLEPLQKRDIRGAYASGAISDDDLEDAIKLTGHTDDAVATLIKEYKPARRHQILGHISIKNWIEQQIDGQECTQQLTEDGYDNDTVSKAMKDSEGQFAKSTWSEAFAKGLLPKEDLIALLTDAGVTANGANKIADKLSYKIVDHQAVANYKVGTVTRNDAKQQMQSYGMQSASAERMLDDADDGIDNLQALECIRGVKHRYLAGELNSDEATSALGGFGLTTERINEYVSFFNCERNAEGKQVAVEKLCHWLYIGAIDQTDMYQRLIKLGYTEPNASLLMVDCVNANTLKAVKQQQAQAKEFASQLAKEKSAVDKVNAANQRQAERLAKMRRDKATLRANRDKQLLSAAEKVYKASDADLATALATVKSALSLAETNYGLSTDESLKIAILASENFKGQDIAAYIPLVQELASVAAASGQEPTDADIAFVPSTNGDTKPAAST